MLVDIYWNIHRGGYSIRAAEGPRRGRVIDHVDSAMLRNARFVVRPGARDRIRAGANKEVHAWVRGELLDDITTTFESSCGVTYNPMRDDSFVWRFDRAPIHTAAYVAFRVIDGRAAVFARQ